MIEQVHEREPYPLNIKVIECISLGVKVMTVEHNSLKAFGEKMDGETYQDRRAVYAVIPDDVGRVAAVVSDSGKLWLPGGEIKAGETPEQALAREVEEECAQRLRIVTQAAESLSQPPGP